MVFVGPHVVKLALLVYMLLLFGHTVSGMLLAAQVVVVFWLGYAAECTVSPGSQRPRLEINREG